MLRIDKYKSKRKKIGSVRIVCVKRKTYVIMGAGGKNNGKKYRIWARLSL